MEAESHGRSGVWGSNSVKTYTADMPSNGIEVLFFILFHNQPEVRSPFLSHSLMPTQSASPSLSLSLRTISIIYASFSPLQLPEVESESESRREPLGDERWTGWRDATQKSKALITKRRRGRRRKHCDRGMARGFRLIFATSLLLTLLGLCRGSTIGVCYGRNADDLPTPDKVAQLVQLHKIKYLRIYDSNIQVLKAFANTGVELMIGISNSDLLPFSQFQSNADTWLRNSILPYYPATRITHITVGAEVTESPNNASSMVVPAMKNVLTALRKAGLHKKIKVSSTHSLGILSRSFPPSAGAFNSSHAFFLKPMLEFLAENQSPFMVDIYPYYAYRDSPNNVSLDYALFESSSEVIDPNTGLLYTNMFDAQIDALYFALMALNFRTIKIMVTETGWPSKGSPKETAATPDNAQTYNTNLIRHVINDTGTPAKPGEDLDVYIFSLFNENRKSGLESERNWGLFYPDQTSVYNLDMTGKGAVTMTTETNVTSSNGTWCIASSTASEMDLQNALDWACGPGNVDCSAIQPSQPCFEPDNVVSHASFAFNSYYQQNGATDIACGFGGSGIKVNKNPSYDNCLYMTTGSNKTAASNATTALASTTTSSAANALFAWTLSCLLMALLSFL